MNDLEREHYQRMIEIHEKAIRQYDTIILFILAGVVGVLILGVVFVYACGTGRCGQ